MPTITRIVFPTILSKKPNVAAYARVSNDKDAMEHSLDAQTSYYMSLIQSNDEWEYAGVYSDNGITGTKENRKEFQRMISDCRNGKINMIITKSISRFARNTVTLLKTVRELKLLEVDIFFEEQNIHTMSAEGELMLTILASYAQEESHSASENQKWRIKKNFEEGLVWGGGMLGYRNNQGVYEIVPEEAEIVKLIYELYLDGNGYLKICKILNEKGIVTRFGNKWTESVVSGILGNYNYTGNLILQKTFRENHITKRTRVNNGELPKYHAEETHEAIIDMQTFEKVQAERERRARKFNHNDGPVKEYPFTGLLVCDKCGKNYRRKTTAVQVTWICATYNTLGKSHCASKQIPESTLIATTQEVTTDISAIKKIVVSDNNILHYHLKNGTVVKKQWKDRSRSESWTDEMKAKAREASKKRRDRNG